MRYNKKHKMKMFFHSKLTCVCCSSSTGGPVSSWYESPLLLRLGAPQTALRKARATSEHSPHRRSPLRLPPLSTVSSRPPPFLQHATALVIPALSRYRGRNRATGKSPTPTFQIMLKAKSSPASKFSGKVAFSLSSCAVFDRFEVRSAWCR